MKKLIAVIGAVILAAVTSQAQNGAPSFILNSYTAPSVPASTTTNLASPIILYAAKQQNETIQLQPSEGTTNNVSGTTNGFAIYTFCLTADGTTLDTNRQWSTPSITMITNGPAIYTTNLNISGYYGEALIAIANNATNGPLTTKITVPMKMSAP